MVSTAGPREILAQAFGPDAEFRDGQWDSIRALVEGRSRCLVVQRTGWGKSVVYFVATRLLRERGSGPTLLISPLLSLMRNQIALAKRFGVNAASIDSSNMSEWTILKADFESGAIDLLLVSPERLANSDFQSEVLSVYLKNPGLLVVDEAHCISDWGHDFRPDYRRIVRLIEKLPKEVPVLATTATANDRVVEDIKRQLGDHIEVVRGPLVRESLSLNVLQLPTQSERLAWLSSTIPKLPGTGIIYTLTVNDARRVTNWLKSQGINAEAYFSELDTDHKIALERRFQANELKVLVATTALGMGYDKSDVGFVIHFQRPGSIIAYYQQVGRAGRDIPKAWVVLLEGIEDDEINEHFIRSAFPDSACFEEVLEILKSGPRTLDHVVSNSNRRRAQIEKALDIMLVEGALTKSKDGYSIDDKNWKHADLNSEQVIKQRLAELEQMQQYAQTDQCRMQFLAEALDDHQSAPCGKCDRCQSRTFKSPPIELVAEASSFLKQGLSIIEPKGFFPPGILAEGRKKIPEDQRLEPGLALSVYGDGGWGTLVKKGKYTVGRFDDALIEPITKAIRALPEKFDWLTWVPSASHPNLVADFAKRLANALGLEAVESVRKIESIPQKEMQNSTTQFRNAASSYQLVETRPGRCLLLDDIVDSGWTLTAVGTLLRKAGCGAVMPFALATARPRDER